MSSAFLRADPFRLLGDPVRLRILRLLAREQLNIGELTQVLGIAQSGVSRHVRLLKGGSFVREEREGGWTWLALAGTADAPSGLGATWAPVREALARAPDEDGDDARLAVIRRERHERRVGWGTASDAEPGRSWSAWARALGHLLPPLAVVDIGCGDGALTREVARWAGRVAAVDSDPGLLARARSAGDPEREGSVAWTEAALDALPFADGSFDLALLSQALHRVDDVAAVLAESVRVVKEGGRVLVLDLLPHDEAWVETKLGHRHRGFEGEALKGLLVQAGLEGVTWEEAARRRGNPFTVLVASGRRPGRVGSSS